MTDDHPSVVDARDVDYVYSESLSKPIAPSATTFTVQFEASGVVGRGTAESIPEHELKKEDQ